MLKAFEFDGILRFVHIFLCNDTFELDSLKINKCLLCLKNFELDRILHSFMFLGPHNSYRCLNDLQLSFGDPS